MDNETLEALRKHPMRNYLYNRRIAVVMTFLSAAFTCMSIYERNALGVIQFGIFVFFLWMWNVFNKVIRLKRMQIEIDNE